MAKIRWEVSKDGKTVKAGGKTYSVDAFRNQFKSIDSPFVTGSNALLPGNVGSAEETTKSVKKVASSPDEARAKKGPVKKTATTRAQVTAAAKGGSIKEAKGLGKTVSVFPDKPRSQGGIGKGADKKVTPVYRMMSRGGGLGGLFGKLPK